MEVPRALPMGLHLTSHVATESFSHTTNFPITSKKWSSSFPAAPGRLRAGLCRHSLIPIASIAPALRIPASVVTPALALEPDLFGVVAPWQLHPGSAP